MNKYKNKYRINSHRLPKWDYAGEGYYFITLVTQNRECLLGKITGDKMELSDWGKIVNDEWLSSFEIRRELFLDEYVMMPNHLHAIVILKNMQNDGDDSDDVEAHGRAPLHHASHHDQPNQSPGSTENHPSDFIRKPKSISSFIAGFKSSVNTKIDDYIDEHQLNIPKYNRNNHFFQPNYHDHIIRNHSEYNRIKHYIINNPSNWSNDGL